MYTLKLNTTKTFKFLAMAVLSLSLLQSCDDDDNPDPVNEEEVITTLRLTLTPIGGGTAVVFQSQDLDGDGPNAPVLSSGNLSASTTYTGTVQVLNELENPADNITLEVAEEDDEHQFFYEFSTGSNVTVTYDDMDDNGDPIGIATTFTTGAASASNTMTVSLIHEPNKSAAGVSAGNSANAGGETDIEASFTFSVN